MTANDLFRQGLTTLGLAPDEQTIARLCRYLAELQKWNRSINLVAKAAEEVLIESHFLDSLTMVPLVRDCPPPGLMDVGSGAGFPGLALKIACPDLMITLVEPRQKRTSFLRNVIRTLDLKKIVVLETRLEKGNEQLIEWQNSTPIMTSRAFTSIKKFLELAETFCAPGGRIICMKGRKANEELAEWRKESPSSPFRLSETIKTTLPFSGTPRTLLVFTKEEA
jgi:16S rRNA (guanine527-N7)-methyltransferase